MSQVFEVPTNALDRVIIGIGRFVAYFYLLAAVIIVWEIVLRYVFNAPTLWAHETTTLICALLYAFGGSHCLSRNKHIRIVLIYGWVSSKVRRRLEIVITSLSTILMIGLVLGGWIMVEKSIFTPQGDFRMETSGSAWDPPFPAVTKIFLFFMLCVMLVQFVVRLIEIVRPKDHA